MLIGILLDPRNGEIVYTEITDIELKGTPNTIRFYIYEHLKRINNIN
jgi:hypothetical protein